MALIVPVTDLKLCGCIYWWWTLQEEREGSGEYIRFHKVHIFHLCIFSMEYELLWVYECYFRSCDLLSAGGAVIFLVCKQHRAFCANGCLIILKVKNFGSVTLLQISVAPFTKLWGLKHLQYGTS